MDEGGNGESNTGLSLVLACYNEVPVLENSVREIVKTLEFTRMTYEMIFVDDCSRDGTPDLIRRIIESYPQVRMKAVYHERNLGRGRAVADGVREAAGEIVGFLDVDLEVHARYIPACCLAIRDGAQVAVGARVFKFVPHGLFRRFLSAAYASLVRAILPVGGLTDTETGCKFFRRMSLLPILDLVEDPGWFWDTETMVRCRLAGLSIVEIPCLYIRNPGNRSSVRVLRDSVTYLARLVAFRMLLGKTRRKTPGGAGG